MHNSSSSYAQIVDTKTVEQSSQPLPRRKRASRCGPHGFQWRVEINKFPEIQGTHEADQAPKTAQNGYVILLQRHVVVRDEKLWPIQWPIIL